MFYKIDDRIVALNGKFPEKKVKSISFIVDDNEWPLKNYNNGRGAFAVKSLKPIKMKILTGDEIFTFESSNEAGSFSYSLTITDNGLGFAGFDESNTINYQSVQFINPTGGTKLITLEFEDITNIIDIRFHSFNMYGRIPFEISYFIKLRELVFIRMNYITEFPPDLNNLNELLYINLSLLGPVFDKIPDSIFNLKEVRELSISSLFDLSNPISSNLFKLNQLDQLVDIDLRNNNIKDYFPDEWLIWKDQMIKLSLSGNSWTEIPKSLEEFSKLIFFYFSIDSSVTNIVPWIDFTKWTELGVITLFGYTYDIQNIPTAWASLVSLYYIPNHFRMIEDVAMFNHFVDRFYILCTNEAYLNVSTAPAEEKYPNKFRDFIWGGSRSQFVPNGTIQAPAGFELGVSNGNLPMTQGEKIYVLKENYGHIITTAQP